MEKPYQNPEAVRQSYKKLNKIARRMGAKPNPHVDDCTGWILIGFYKKEAIWIDALGTVSFWEAAKYLTEIARGQLKEVSTPEHPAG